MTPTSKPTTTSGPLNLNDAHDLVYENVDFEGRGSGYGDDSGLIHITGASYNITFRNCTIGTNQDGVGNGVKLLDSGRGMHDITFENCTFKYQPRMGIEVNGRADPSEGGTGGKSYYNVNVRNCTFEASAGEAISYDDNTAGKANRAGLCTVSGNLVKGAGVGTTYQYGQVFEINGNHDMVVTGNTFYAGRDGILNFQMHDTNGVRLGLLQQRRGCDQDPGGRDRDQQRPTGLRLQRLRRDVPRQHDHQQGLLERHLHLRLPQHGLAHDQLAGSQQPALRDRLLREPLLKAGAHT